MKGRGIPDGNGFLEIRAECSRHVPNCSRQNERFPVVSCNIFESPRRTSARRATDQKQNDAKMWLLLIATTFFRTPPQCFPFGFGVIFGIRFGGDGG